MKRAIVLLTALATVFALVLPAVAGDSVQPERPAPVTETPDEWVNETPSSWFIELPSPPAADGTSKSQLAKERKAFRDAAQSAGIEFDEQMEFDTLFNGLSVQAEPSQLVRLAQLSQVEAIYPVEVIPMPSTETSGPDLATAIQMTGADVAQNELGLTGEGIRVAVMDTGIDYDHPDLGGCFGSSCRVAVGWDFVGDDFNADPESPAYNPIAVPDPDPDDCQGHGTHVSGIVGANGDAVGVAPGVTFGAYRVFGCDGSTTSDIMIAAMERALADGMDILNMSIGSAYTWPQYPTAVAANRLVDEGMVVVASIGNSGATGTYSAGAPGLGEKVIGVAAIENILATFQVAEVDDAATEPRSVGYIPMEFSAATPTSGTEDIVFVGRGCPAGDYSGTVLEEDDPYEADPAGKIALIVRGVCPFGVKVQRAIDAGATAVVIHNNAPGNFNGTLGAPPSAPQIAVSISQEDGEYLRSLTDPTWTWTEDFEAFPNPDAGLIADFSSYGLAPDLSLKPDIGAPGGNIFSTYPLEKGGYANLGGTSMASPHVAGAAALMLEARPDTPVASMREILQNSADPIEWFGIPGSVYLEPVHRQGAGLVDIDDAILQSNRVSPGKLALGESEGTDDPIVREIQISNDGDEPVTYTLGAENLENGVVPIATKGTFPDAEGLTFFLSGETVEFSQGSVTVPAGGTATVTVTVRPEPSGGNFDLVQYGGWITVTPDDESDVLRVPYSGFIGDYQQLEVLTPSAFGVFPALGVTSDGTNFGLADEGQVYTMEGFDVPNLLLHMHHQSRQMVVEVYGANGRPVHPVFYTAMVEDYLPRNATNAGFFAFPWDGTRLHSQGNKPKTKTVPDGEYYLVAKILKALGDPDNPDHWETFQTPVFEIDRP